MGDMKTPDFDDLLAAFDIPDIDAKEALQSRPEEERNEEVGTNADVIERESPSGFTSSPAHHSNKSVSVIVKNNVLSESVEEEGGGGEGCASNHPQVNNSSSSGEDSEAQVKLSDFTSQLGPNEAPVDLQIVNGLEGSATRAQPQCSPLRSTGNTSEKNGNGAETGSDNNTSDVMDTLKPLLYPQSLTSGGITSSCPPSPHSVSLHHPPHSPQKEETCILSNAPSSSLPQNGNLKAGIMLSDEDDSEPDLGGPLVIQESPESVMTPLPKFKRRANLQSDLLGSPEKTTYHISDPPHLSSPLVSKDPKPKFEEEGQPSTPRSPSTATQPQSPQHCPPSVSTSTPSVQVERYPEHVIEERDSPESPPPSETGFMVSNRSTSPDLDQTAGLTNNPKDSHCNEELMESEHSQDERPEVTEELTEKVETANGESLNEESTGAVAFSEDTLSASAEINSSPLRPLKVKIKMPTGSITRTVTGAAPKKGGRTTARTVKGSKSSSEGLDTRSKRGVLQQSKSNAVALQQGTCATTRNGASTVKGAKVKISCTAVSITKNTALPSFAASSKVSPGGINLQSLGQKTLNNGTALPPPSPLLPPQNSSRPASIVNSTGATISKTQTSLVEAFNKILNNKNLLPTYKPDLASPIPAEWGLTLPAQGYRCLECGDAFALEQSLARHYDRRSLRIEVTCNHCAKRLAFFNKCSLLLHAREHKERGLIMQCSHLVMKPVSMEQMIGRPEPAALAPSSFLGQFTPNAAPQSHNRKAEEVQYCNNKCPECQAQFSSTKEVAEHLQEVKTAQSSPCKDCSLPMLLSNSCFAAAHQRIHQGNPPHVCPECGGTVKQPQFKTHLDGTCLHFARRIGYRCSSCLVVFGGLNSVKSHIQQAHCDMFHKCPSCPMAFKSSSSIQSHITAQHPTLTEAQTMLIYKCVMCDTVFTHKSLLYSHFDNHLANQKVHVFKCPECTKLFSQRNSLLDHFKIHKTAKVKQELPSSSAVTSCSQPLVKMESSDGDEWMDEPKQKRLKTERMKTPSGWKCLTCQTHYTEREDFITHMAEQHGKILKKFPCNKCESSFTTTSSMRRHIRDKHKIMTRGFRCQFCMESKKTFSSRAMLERHVQLRHHMDTISQETVVGGRDEADSSSEHDGTMVARQRRRAAVKAEQDEESTNGPSPGKKPRPSSAPAPSCLPESGFRCAPCGFTTEDKALFLEHISQHRRSGTEGGGQQCMQCGACFTSTSSLSRHRFIIHKVRDAFADNQELLSAHPAASPGSSRKHDDKSSQSGSAPASPSLPQGKEEEGTLACKVCGKQFEKTTDLNTHFRTHGMAFINARNAGKTS